MTSTSNQSTNYYLNAGDSLSIASGTYTGQVNSNSSTAKITVAQNANFNPSSFEFLGTLRVFGAARLPRINGYSAGLKVINSGVINVTGQTYVTGGTITNNYGASMNLTGLAQFQNGSATLANKGTINATGGMYFGNGVLTNNGNIVSQLDLNFDANSNITNSGKLHTRTTLVVQNTTFVNTCRTIGETGIKLLGSTSFTNNGLLWASNAKNSSYLENQATIICQSGSVIKSTDLYNFGTIRGSGFLYFTGVTRTQGVVGTSGITLNSLFVYDVTRTSNATIFDYQAGTVNASAAYVPFAAPDTVNGYPNCAAEMFFIPLAIKWNYFVVNVSNSIPALNWSADQDPGTLYQVQRSYDGIEFTTIANIASETNKSAYSYNDAQANTQHQIIYYRIKAIEPTGSIKYSDTRTARFSNKPGMTIQTVPNPFTSQFTVNYQTTKRELISIKVYSLNGQLQITKNFNAAVGYNSINITEAGHLAKGMYMVQLSSENKIVATEKVVKQ